MTHPRKQAHAERMLAHLEKQEARNSLPILRCHTCNGGERTPYGRICRACDGNGTIFWVRGHSFPYSPEGEERALRYLAKAEDRP
jgi:hypothetical protein